MARTVVALYDRLSTARDVANDLVDAGFSRDDISLVANDVRGEYSPYVSGDVATDANVAATSDAAGTGAGIGAVIGAIGGLLVGLGALAIPGIGPVIAAGPLATALSGLAGAGVGAVAGGVTGGLIGALVDMGVPQETAGYYAEGIRRGGTLVTVHTDDMMADKALQVMNRHNPVDIDQRVSTWREAGWTGYNPSAEPYTAEDLDRETARFWDTTATTTGDFDRYEQDFRNHYQTSLAGTGYTYDYYRPGYQYGYMLATNPTYRDYDWDRLEPVARSEWELRHEQGAWEDFKDSVRHAWEEVKDAVS